MFKNNKKTIFFKLKRKLSLWKNVIIPELGFLIRLYFNFWNRLDRRLIDQKREKRIVISLTSYPQRLNKIHFTVYSILRQSVKADVLVIWLANEDFPSGEKDLPWNVKALMKMGLTVKWHSNLRSYLKLVPSLSEYPNDVIITADDDVYYPENWLEILYTSYLKNPDSIHCHRAHKIKFDQDQVLLPYLKWEFYTKRTGGSYSNFLTGHGGVLYPPNCLHVDVFSTSKFMLLSPAGDDIWFWAMAVLKKTKITIPEGHFSSFKTVGGTQESSLYYENWDAGRYDQQIRAVFAAYPQLKDFLLKECVDA